MKPRVPARKHKKFIEFVEFLKANDALSYFEYCNKWIFETADIEKWIFGSFVWSESREEIEFWSAIHEQRQDKLQREQNR